MIETVFGILLPFFGTALGSSAVYLIKKEPSKKITNILYGFASGVMVAAAVWSLLIPSIELAAADGVTAFVPAVLGFLAGVGFLLLLDKVIPHLHFGALAPEGTKSSLSKKSMLFLAVTLHNLPEGMAVGVVFAGLSSGGSQFSVAGALALSLGISIQNFPEGAIISMPSHSSGVSRNRAFGYGVLSGVVEPIGAVVTILLTSMITPILPYVLSFAAGAMVYVVVEELIPESHSVSDDCGTLGFAAGFALMMLLDVALG